MLVEWLGPEPDRDEPVKEWRKEVWKVSINKSFDAYSKKENREVGQWLESDMDLGKSFFFSFFKEQRPVVICLYVERNYLFTEEVS